LRNETGADFPFFSLTSAGADQDYARTRAGEEALIAGNCSLAYSHLHQLAMESYAWAENDIGVFYDRGCPSMGIQIDLVKAAEWFDRAAQHGNTIGKRNAAQHAELGYGQRVDMQKALNLYRAAAKAGDKVSLHRLAVLDGFVERPIPTTETDDTTNTIDMIAQALGAAVAGSQRHRVAPTPQPYQAFHPQPVTPTGTCNYDMDCGMSRICVKPQGQIGLGGTCVTPVNQFGTPQLIAPHLSSGPTVTSPCQFDTECGIGFTCVKQANELVGVCLK
jgi:hypothetical protein